ncbi:MAG: hypothetical protein AAF989_01030 [Planctomycetota bacterium]
MSKLRNGLNLVLILVVHVHIWTCQHAQGGHSTAQVDGSSAETAETKKKVLVVVGPSKHPPGSHEVTAGGRLVAATVSRFNNLSGMTGVLSIGWPDESVRRDTDTIVFIGDMFPPMRLPQKGKILDELGSMMDSGCGIVCLHYANGLEARDVGPNGEHPLLGWLGGYFATRCNHHRSVARIFKNATIEKAPIRRTDSESRSDETTSNRVGDPDANREHPIQRGWQPFTLHDEPYINNYFGPNDNQMAAGAFAVATSMLPPEDPKPQVVAWGIERGDGGRGFGIVMPHFFRSWDNDELRKMIFNGIVWTAKAEVPFKGVEVDLQALESYDPVSVDFRPRKK